MEVKPSPELLQLCPKWVPFLLKKHRRDENKEDGLDIMDTKMCMVGEAWNFTIQYVHCDICRNIALDLDDISALNRSENITPKQVIKMIKKANTFANHYMKKHKNE
jgi:ribosomal protein S15P/S13E